MLHCNDCDKDYEICPQCTVLSCPGCEPEGCPYCEFKRDKTTGSFPTKEKLKGAFDKASDEILQNINLMQCVDCGEIDHVVFDGEVLGPELSSVTMEVKVQGKRWAIRAADKDEYYWETLDQEAWINKAIDFLKTFPTVLCPKCDNTVRLDPTQYSDMCTLNPMAKIGERAMKDLHGGAK